MLVPETVVIAVYVMVDDFQRAELPPVARRGGQQPALSRSEVLTLGLLSQLACFPSERAFHRFAVAQWRHLFPRLPHRSQLNRAIRAQATALAAFGRCCARHLDALTAEYEVLDCTAVPLRASTRRGVGAMPEVAARGKSLRLGWFVGVRLLIAVTPSGVVRARWLALGADVLAPPQEESRERWPPAARAQHRRKRQIVETVFARLHGAFRLDRDRPRSLGGLWARLAAKIALSNALIRLNAEAGRPGLRLTGLVM